MRRSIHHMSEANWQLAAVDIQRKIEGQNSNTIVNNARSCLKPLAGTESFVSTKL